MKGASGILFFSSHRTGTEVLPADTGRDPGEEKEFYLTVSDDEAVDKIYHAVLKDHPEIYWAHNRESVYKTTYDSADYCLFAPSYLYSEAE